MPNIVWGQILNTFQVWHFINGLHVKLFRELYKWSSHPMIIRHKPTMVSKPCSWTRSPSWGNLPGRWFSNDMFDWGTSRTSDNVGHYLTLSGGYNVQPFSRKVAWLKKYLLFPRSRCFLGVGCACFFLGLGVGGVWDSVGYRLIFWDRGGRVR